MKTIALIHGWAGGGRHTNLFAKSLENSGLKVIKNTHDADCIFAHSTGCYMLPPDNKAKLIVLHGPPYWPGKSLRSRLFDHKGDDIGKLVKNFGIAHVLRRFWWETVYIIIHPQTTHVALKHHKKLDFLDNLKKQRVLLVRNKEDAFCSPDIKEVVKSYKNVKYAELPDGHDDYYTNPKPYIDLILKNL